jgi:transaldolase
MPEETLLAFADHGKVNDVLPVDGGDAEEILARFAKVGVDNAALATQLQREGALSFDKSWNELMDSMPSKSNALGKATQPGGKR